MPGFIGMPELLLLALVALVLFGPKRLPEMGRGLGKGLREFKDSVSGDHKDDARLRRAEARASAGADRHPDRPRTGRDHPGRSQG